MSWFKRNKNEPAIPPVQEPALDRLPSYRSTQSQNSYSSNRYGDQAPSYGADSYRSSSNPSPISRQGSDSYNSSTKRDLSSYGSGRYGARKEEAPTADRSALFAGAAPREEGKPNRFEDGPTMSTRPPPPPGEEGEDDVEAIKSQTKFLKQDTAQSTRNALRMAREAEETGRNTLLRLGEQSEKIANTERHLDVSKGHSRRADDNAEEIRQLNRSIFIPVMTLDKKNKRAAEELKREQRYNEENEERDRAMGDIRDSQGRIGRDLASGSRGAYGYGGDGEAIGGRRTRTEADKAQRKRYQFEATASDDELEDEIDDNLDALSGAVKSLSGLGKSMRTELDAQNERLGRISDKASALDNRIVNSTYKLKAIK